MNRRHFLHSLLAMPAVVAVSSLMPVRGIIVPKRLVITSLDEACGFDNLIALLRPTRIVGRIGQYQFNFKCDA